jgi:putative ABC transport system permease protein
MAALHATDAASDGVPARRNVVGVIVLAAGAAALLVGLLADVPHQVPVVGIGVLGVFAGVTVLGPALSPPLCRFLGRPIVRLRGTAGALARDNALRSPRRTAATASALMIGVGLVAFITVFVSSTKASVNDVVQKAFTGDLVVDSGAGLTGGVSPALAQDLRALPEVAAASGLRLGPVQIDGKADILGAIDPADGFQILQVGVLAGDPAKLGSSAIAVQADEARALGLHIGDTVPVTFAKTGTQNLRVVLIYQESNPAGKYLLGTPAYDANFATSYDRQIFVKKTPGVTDAALTAAVSKVATAYPGVDVLSRAEFVDKATGPMDQMLALVYVLLSLAIGIALLGIGNTLALSIHERVREIGLLRAVGMTRGQLRSAIRWESMIVALQGTILGLAVGIFFGWALTLALADQGISVFHVPAGQLAVVALIAAAAGVAAGMLPARRAARLDVLRALNAH